MEAKEALHSMILDQCQKIVFSNGNADTRFRRITITQDQNAYQAEKLTQKQAFHETIAVKDLLSVCMTYLDMVFRQVNGFSSNSEHALKISKKKQVFYRKKAHLDKPLPLIAKNNRKKHYLIEEGTIVPALVDMGIFSAEGKVIHAMYDKFRQINKFIEIIDDVIRKLDLPSYQIIDFGCGKSYLTFLVYYYLVEVKKCKVEMVGLDLKADVIEKCNESAKRYGYDHLHFEVGDIAKYQRKGTIDLVISLHACDTATDHALYHAICWNAKAILSVPCCQHELNAQLQSEQLAIFQRYGIIQERSAALMTDMIRANLLQACGYKTQVLEFVDLTHTPKNLLIRAVKSNLSKAHRDKVMQEAEALMKCFHLSPTLYRLLKDE